jgi:hypothetical protein
MLEQQLFATKSKGALAGRPIRSALDNRHNRCFVGKGRRWRFCSNARRGAIE